MSGIIQPHAGTGGAGIILPCPAPLLPRPCQGRPRPSTHGPPLQGKARPPPRRPDARRRVPPGRCGRPSSPAAATAVLAERLHCVDFAAPSRGHAHAQARVPPVEHVLAVPVPTGHPRPQKGARGASPQAAARAEGDIVHDPHAARRRPFVLISGPDGAARAVDPTGPIVRKVPARRHVRRMLLRNRVEQPVAPDGVASRRATLGICCPVYAVHDAVGPRAAALAPAAIRAVLARPVRPGRHQAAAVRAHAGPAGLAGLPASLRRLARTATPQKLKHAPRMVRVGYKRAAGFQGMFGPSAWFQGMFGPSPSLDPSVLHAQGMRARRRLPPARSGPDGERGQEWGRGGCRPLLSPRAFQPLTLVPLALGTVHLMALYLAVRPLASTDHDVAVLNAATIAAAYGMAAAHCIMDRRRRRRLHRQQHAPAVRSLPPPPLPSIPSPFDMPTTWRDPAQVEGAVQAGRYYDYILLHDPEARQRAMPLGRAVRRRRRFRRRPPARAAAPPPDSRP